MITRENADMNWLENIVVGIVGALVGGFLYGLLSGDNFTKHFNLGTLLVATVGAVVVLFAYRAVRHRAA